MTSYKWVILGIVFLLLILPLGSAAKVMLRAAPAAPGTPASPATTAVPEPAKSIYDYTQTTMMGVLVGVKSGKMYVVNMKKPGELGEPVDFSAVLAKKSVKVKPHEKASSVTAKVNNDALLALIRQNPRLLHITLKQDGKIDKLMLHSETPPYEDSSGRVYFKGKMIGSKVGNQYYFYKDVPGVTTFSEKQLKSMKVGGVSKDETMYASSTGQLFKVSKTGQITAYTDLYVRSPAIRWELERQKRMNDYNRLTAGKTDAQIILDPAMRQVAFRAMQYDGSVKKRFSGVDDLVASDQKTRKDIVTVTKERDIALSLMNKAQAELGDEEERDFIGYVFAAKDYVNKLNNQLRVLLDRREKSNKKDRKLGLEIRELNKEHEIAMKHVTVLQNELGRAVTQRDKDLLQKIAKYKTVADSRNESLADLKSQLVFDENEAKQILAEINKYKSIEKPSTGAWNVYARNYEIDLPYGYRVLTSKDGKNHILQQTDAQGNIREIEDPAKIRGILGGLGAEGYFKDAKDDELINKIIARQQLQTFLGTLVGGPRTLLGAAFSRRLNEHLGWAEKVDEVLESTFFKPELWETWICTNIVDTGAPEDVKLGEDPSGVPTIIFRLQGSKEEFPAPLETEAGPAPDIVLTETLYEVNWMVRPATKPIIYTVCLGGCGEGCLVPQSAADIRTGPGSATGNYYANYLEEEIDVVSICYREEEEPAEDEDDEPEYGDLQEYTVPFIPKNYDGESTLPGKSGIGKSSGSSKQGSSTPSGARMI